MTAKKGQAKSFTELSKVYQDAFGVGLTADTKGKTFTVKEAEGTLVKGTTQSSRLNWLKRRARAHGFQAVTPGVFNFVGTEEEPETQTPAN